MIGRASGILADAATEAVEVLRALLSDDLPSIRLAASRAILDQVVRVREATEIEDRLAALEARAGEAGPNVVPLKGWRGGA
jgi:hypothetical protein